MNAPSAVGHLDADCFYVSAERARDPFLGHKAVGVLGNQGACVIAKSYEMKAAGVATGMPIWEALVRCPEGVYIKRDFRWYETLSRQMLECVREHSPRVEYYSIDEFFFQAIPPPGGTFQDAAESIGQAVERAAGVPVTVGIARTRTLAKLVSDTAKPAGALAVLDPDCERDYLAGLPVDEITGIAGRRAARLLAWGIRTCLDLARADRRLVRELLTATGEALWWELNGEPVHPILPQRPQHKTISRGGSIGQPTDDPAILYAWLVRNVERLVEELHYHAVRAGRLTVQVMYKDGRAAQGQANFTAPTDRFDLLLDTARPCLRRAWIPHADAWRMHLITERLAPRGAAQLSLFDPPGPRDDALAQTKRAINDHIGRFALRSAATLPLGRLYHDPASSYDICDIREKHCF